MRSNGNLLTGIIIGVGISAAAYYYYINNREKVDDFLLSQGIKLPQPSPARNYSEMSLEELVSTREHIEDIIAEIEYKTNEAANKEQKNL